MWKVSFQKRPREDERLSSSFNYPACYESLWPCKLTYDWEKEQIIRRRTRVQTTIKKGRLVVPHKVDVEQLQDMLSKSMVSSSSSSSLPLSSFSSLLPISLSASSSSLLSPAFSSSSSSSSSLSSSPSSLPPSSSFALSTCCILLLRLPSALLEIIASFFSSVSLVGSLIELNKLSWMRFRPLASSFTKKITCRNLRSLLQEVFCLDLSLVAEALKQAKGILAGSSVLQCVLGERFSSPEGDLDFFIPNEYVSTFEAHLQSWGYQLGGSTESTYVSSGPFKCGATDTYVFVFGDSNVVEGCKSYIDVRKRKVQLVRMAPKVPARAAVINFDYSFVQVLFDGERFETWAPRHVFSREGIYNPERLRVIADLWHVMWTEAEEGVKSVWVSDAEAVQGYGPRRLALRLAKYEAREFKINGPKPPKEWSETCPPSQW